MERAKANIAAIEILDRLEQEQRPATPQEQRALARWSGWGAVPQIFKPRPDEQFAPLQARLRELLTEDEWREARANTKNAHYTDPQIVQQVWAALGELGFTGGQVLEPGSGSGNFIGYAPDGADVTGVELDPITARIAKALYPRAEIRNESFGGTRAPNGTFDLTVGNVPFGSYKITDLVHNKGGHSIHNHFILKSLELTRPGGLVAVITSSLTMDGHGQKAESARMEMAAKGELVGAIRLPSGAHQRTAGTTVVTDLLILRRRETDKDFTSGRTRKGEVKPLSQRGPKDPPMWVHCLPRFGLPGQADPDRDKNAQPVFYNAYFHDRPEQILGTLSVGHGAHRADELRVDSDGDPITSLHSALNRVVEEAKTTGLAYRKAPENRKRVTLLPPGSPRVDGHVQAEPDGTFTQVRDAMVHPVHVPKAQADEARKLLAIRDTFQSLLAEESRKDADEALIDRLRTELSGQYEEYVAKYGAINRFTWANRTVVDPVTGEKTTKPYRKKAARGGLFRKDPTMANIASLDSQDDTTGEITRAAIFSKRQGTYRGLPEHAESPQDALAVVLEQDGRLTPEGLARVMGVDTETAVSRLLAARSTDPDTGIDYPLAFRDPDGELVPAADYLSGNVREKLARARTAVLDDPGLDINIEHLERVIPPDVSTGEIAAPMGAAWIGREPVERFLRETLGSEHITVSWQGGALWTVDASANVKRSIANRTRHTWSAPGYDALKIAEAVLTDRRIRVTVEIDGELVVDRQATEDAQTKAELLKEEFTDWLWRDPDRAERFHRLYNDTFNAMAPRSYDGQRRTMPGLVEWFKPHPHQHAAVARMVNEPSVLLAHEVGAGKTAEMTMGVMELRRLGLVKKALIVVPGHMLDQFRDEFAELYPEAVANNRILMAGSHDLEGNGRREFIARAAGGDFDAIILTQTAFESIQMRPEVQENYIRARLDKLEAKILSQKAIDGEDNDTRLVKRMEKQLSTLRTKLEKKIAGLKDQAGLHFEDMGIDYLVVDEAHMYKNLYTPSAIESVAIEGSNRASDLEMKLEWLRANSVTGRVATFATATPVANSIAETYVMMRYLRPDLLQQLGLEDFDDFRSVFAQMVSAVERSASGSYAEKMRLAAFQNVPELMRLWRTFADVKTSEDLDLPVPDIVGGKAVTITVPMSEAQEEYEQHIRARAARLDAGRVDPREDNHLKLLSDGRAAALDPRLRDPDAGPGNKLPAVADNVARIYEQTKDIVYPTSKNDPTPHPTPGGLQIIFLDLGTPKDPSKAKKKGKQAETDDLDDALPGDREEEATADFSTYEELKKLLVARGVPEEKIRFIHEAKDDAAKARLFHDARTGKISVLLGSTFKMGTGTNVQLRATTLHHVDAPWRPADVEQRNGRILRQGNANPQVAIFQYATERSTDAKFWEAIARKSRFIQQLMRGSINERVVEDIGDIKFDPDEASALIAGDPHLIAQATLRPVVKRLRARHNAYQRSQEGFQRAIRDAETSERHTADLVATLEDALSRRKNTRGDDFNARIGGTSFAGTEGREAARGALNAQLRKLMVDGRQRAWAEAEGSPAELIGQVGGLDVTARYHRKWDGYSAQYRHTVTVALPAIPGSDRDYHDHDLADQNGKPQRLPLARVEDTIAAIEARIRYAQDSLADKKKAAEQASARLGKPFELADEFARAERQMAVLDRIMRLKAQNPVTEEDQRAHRQEFDALDQELRALNGGEDDVLTQVAAKDLDLLPKTPAPPTVTQDSQGRTRYVWPDAEAREAARRAQREARKREAQEQQQRRRGPAPVVQEEPDTEQGLQERAEDRAQGDERSEPTAVSAPGNQAPSAPDVPGTPAASPESTAQDKADGPHRASAQEREQETLAMGPSETRAGPEKTVGDEGAPEGGPDTDQDQAPGSAEPDTPSPAPERAGPSAPDPQQAGEPSRNEDPPQPMQEEDPVRLTDPQLWAEGVAALTASATGVDRLVQAARINDGDNFRIVFARWAEIWTLDQVSSSNVDEMPQWIRVYLGGGDQAREDREALHAEAAATVYPQLRAEPQTAPAPAAAITVSPPDVAETAAPEQSSLQDLIDGFGDRVAIGHIGGPQPARTHHSVKTDDPEQAQTEGPQDFSQQTAPSPEMAKVAAILRYYEPLLQRHGLSGTVVAEYVDRPGYGYTYDPGMPLWDLTDRIARKGEQLAGMFSRGRRGYVIYEVGEERGRVGGQMMDLANSLIAVATGGDPLHSVDLDAILAAPPGTVIDLPPETEPAAQETASAIVINHDAQGTTVHGTQRDDPQTQNVLKLNGFRWSRRQSMWYQPRNTPFAERDSAVHALRTDLDERGVSCTYNGPDPEPETTGDAPAPQNEAEMAESAAETAQGIEQQAAAQAGPDDRAATTVEDEASPAPEPEAADRVRGQDAPAETAPASTPETTVAELVGDSGGRTDDEAEASPEADGGQGHEEVEIEAATEPAAATAEANAASERGVEEDPGSEITDEIPSTPQGGTEAAEPAAETEQGDAADEEALLASLEPVKVTGAAGIRYQLVGELTGGQPATVRFHVTRVHRGIGGTVDFSGTREECLAYIESKEAVLSAAAAWEENAAQQARALAWMQERGVQYSDFAPEAWPPVAEVVGAAGIKYRIWAADVPEQPREIQVARTSRGNGWETEYRGSLEECLTYIESEAAVRSAAEAAGENAEQQAAAQAWLDARATASEVTPGEETRQENAAPTAGAETQESAVPQQGDQFEAEGTVSSNDAPQPDGDGRPLLDDAPPEQASGDSEIGDASENDEADEGSATVVQTPDGPGTVLGMQDGLVLVSTASSTRVYERAEVQWPGDTAPAVNPDTLAKERQNAEDLAAAATPEGIELPYGGGGNRLRDLDVEAGHGTVVDRDGEVVGWVRARLGDDGRRYWWAQDADGGPPDSMPFHESLPVTAGVPAIRAASHLRDDVIASSSVSQRSPVGAEYAAREIKLTTAQVRELRTLPLTGTYSDGRPIAVPEWVASHRRYVLSVAQMRALANAAAAAAEAIDDSTVENRRAKQVLRNAVAKLEFEQYDTARHRATIPPPGEPDRYAGPYRPSARADGVPAQSDASPASGPETHVSPQEQTAPATTGERTGEPEPDAAQAAAERQEQDGALPVSVPSAPSRDNSDTLREEHSAETPESGQLGLFPADDNAAEQASPARPANRRMNRTWEPAEPRVALGDGALSDGRLGVHGNAGIGTCDRCGTADTNCYITVFHWSSDGEMNGDMSQQCAPCVEITVGVPVAQVSQVADLADARRGGRRIELDAPTPHDDVVIRRTGENEWTSVHVPTGRRFRTSKESESGYRGYVTRDMDGISYGVGPSAISYAVTQRAALGRTAETHPATGDDWARFAAEQTLQDVVLLDGEHITEAERRRVGWAFLTGPLWDMTIRDTRFVVELVYQQGPRGSDGHRLSVTGPDQVPIQHESWHDVLAWARERARTTEGRAITELQADQPVQTREEPTAVAEEPSTTTDTAPSAELVPPAPEEEPQEPPTDQLNELTNPLVTDPRYQLVLVGGEQSSRGELRYDGATVAAVLRSAGGEWFTRLSTDGLPSVMTTLASTAQEAAHRGAILHALHAGVPYGSPPAAAQDNGGLSRADVLRGELRAAAELHQDEIAKAAARIWPSSYEQNPHMQQLTARLDTLRYADADKPGAAQMAAQLADAHEAATAWRAVLPSSTAEEYQFLAFALTHIAYDVARLQERLQTTADAVREERAAQQREEAAQPTEGTESLNETLPEAAAAEQVSTQQPGTGQATETAVGLLSDPDDADAVVEAGGQAGEPDYESLYAAEFDQPLAPLGANQPDAVEDPSEVTATPTLPTEVATMAEEPQQPAIPIPDVPALSPIEDAGTEEAAVRAEARVRGLRALWNMGPAALGLPENVHATVGTALRQAGEQAAAEADQYRAQHAAEADTTHNDLDEEELEPSDAGPSAAAVQLDADAPQTDGYLADYRAGRPPRDEAAAEAYREWRQLDAEHQEAAVAARDLENEYERYQGTLSWSEWLQQNEALKLGSTETPDDPGPGQPPRNNAAAETAEVNDVAAPDEPRSAVETRTAATTEVEHAGQVPVEATADVPTGEAHAEDPQASPNAIGAAADAPGSMTFAQIMTALAQLQQSAAAERAAAAGPQEPSTEPITALSQGVAQLGAMVDPPGTPQPEPDLGLAAFEEVEQAYAAATQHGREYNGAREWKQLGELWQSSQRVWESARDVLRRSGARVADRVRGICRAVGIRVADGVARLSDRLAERMAKAGRDGSPGHRALRSLSQAAQNGATRLRDRAENFAAFGQITDSLREMRADLARGTDADSPRPEASADAQAPATPDRDKDAYQLVNEAFGSASQHNREYNGAPEWRRLTAVWPMASRVLGEQRANALARYGADLATDIRWQGAMRTAGVRTLDTVARLSHKLAERLAKAGRHDSPGRRAIQDLGHTAQRAASTVRGDEAADRVAAFDRLGEAIRDLQADLAKVLDDGPGRSAVAAVPFGEPSRPRLAAGEGQRAEAARPDDPRERPAAMSGGPNTGAGVGE